MDQQLENIVNFMRENPDSLSPETRRLLEQCIATVRAEISESEKNMRESKIRLARVDGIFRMMRETVDEAMTQHSQEQPK